MTEQNVYENVQKQFFVNGLEHDRMGIPAAKLKDVDVMKHLIERRTAEFGATDLRVGGANMMRWFGQFFTAHFFLYSRENQLLTYDDFTFVEMGKKAEIYLEGPSLKDVDVTYTNDEFSARLQMIFTEFRPIIENIATCSNLSIQQVWGLITNPFYNKYFDWISEGNNELEQQLQMNLQVIKKIEPDVFGIKRNPFDVSFQYVDHWKDTTDNVRIKTACCMSYLKENGNNCYSCPKVTKEQRKKRGQELLLKK